MKRILLLLTLLGALNFLNINKAASQCSDLSINTMFYDTSSGSIKGTILNSGNWYVIYPFFRIKIDTNSYISSNTYIVQSYLDSAGGSNNGLSDFFFSASLSMPWNSIPFNTTVSGTFTIEDPNDTANVCKIPFQWQIKAGNTTDVVYHEKEKFDFNVFPNPLSTGILNLDFDEQDVHHLELVDCTGRRIMDIPLTGTGQQHQLDMRDLVKGIYFIKFLTNEGWNMKKIVKI